MPQTTVTKPKAMSSATDDFWLVQATNDSNNSLVDTLHALYYLPENYRLIVISDNVQKDTLHTFGHLGLKKRVKLIAKTETSADKSPFLVADAIISHTKQKTTKPNVTIAESATTQLEGDAQNGFTVAAGNPLALASAIFSLARAI